jgi:hypothetical protein
MEILLPIALLAGLCWWWAFSASATVVARVRGGWHPAGAGRERHAPAADTVDCDILTLPFVLRRMEVVADELERLERDPAVFARAFRTVVARSAYEALIADASRLAAIPSLDLDRRLDFDLDLDLEGTPTQRREVLNL